MDLVSEIEKQGNPAGTVKSKVTITKAGVVEEA